MTGYTTNALRSCVEKFFPDMRNIPGFSRIPTGLFNTSYIVDTADGRLVLRIAPPADTTVLFYEKDMMRQEPSVHRILLEKTTVPVPRIYAFDTSLEVLDSEYMLMEYLEGSPLSSSTPRREDVLGQLGEKIAETHAITSRHYGYIGDHHPMEPAETWVDAFSIMWKKMIEDVSAHGYYSPDEVSLLLRLFDCYRGLFDRSVPSSLLHMDIWDQNILVDADNTLCGIIDWDRCLWGDPEIEFAVLDYSGISAPSFWEGYGRKRDISREARMRNVFYLLYEIQKYIVIRAGRHGDKNSAAMYKQHVLDIVSRVFY